MNTEKYTSLLIRLGLSIVFLLFGIDKFIRPLFWSAFVPKFLSDIIPFSLNNFIYLIGIIETILGALILIGLFTRVASILSAMHLLLIIISLAIPIGYNDIIVRDLGLFFMALTLSFFKNYQFSLDNIKKKP